MGDPHLCVFVNAIIVWMDELEDIISPAFMSLMVVGSLYWTTGLTVLSPHYYENEGDLLLLKGQQRGVGSGEPLCSKGSST